MDRCVTIPADHVCVPLEVYEDLLKDSDKYYALKNALFENAVLAYTKKDLTILDSELRLILRMVDRNRYRLTLEGLQREEEERNEERTDQGE